MVRKATRFLRFVAEVEDPTTVVGLDVLKQTYSIVLLSNEDGLVESYTCSSDEATLAHQLTNRVSKSNTLSMSLIQPGSCLRRFWRRQVLLWRNKKLHARMLPVVISHENQWKYIIIQLVTDGALCLPGYSDGRKVHAGFKLSHLQRARLRNTRPSSPFGLHPHWDEGRVLHFRLEVGQQ